MRSHVRLLGTIARIVANRMPDAGEGTDQVTVDDSFLLVARRHRLYPITSFALSRDPTIIASPTARQALDRQHVAVAGRNLGIVSQLAELVRAFDRHAIPVMAFKGPVIARSVYGSVSRREFDDLDLIVDGNDLGRSRSLLESCGYRLDAPQPRGRRSVPRAHHDVFVPASEVHVPVELHCDAPRWHFPVRSRVDDLLARSALLPLGGQAVRVPGAEDQLLLMCVHAASHAWTCLEHVLAIAVAIVVASPSFDWSFVAEESQRVGALRMLRLGLALARRICGVAIDAEIERLVGSDPRIEHLSALVARRLFEPTRPPAPQRTLTHVRSLDSVTDQLRYAMRRMAISVLQ